MPILHSETYQLLVILRSFNLTLISIRVGKPWRQTSLILDQTPSAAREF